MQVNYTYSHAIGSNDNSDGGPPILVERLMYLNQRTSGFDRTQSLQIMHVWELPFGKGKKYLSNGGAAGFIAGGWQLSGVASFITGTPITAWSNESGWNTPGSSQTADQILSNVAKLGGVGIGQPYYDPAAFANPDAPRLGTSGMNKLRGPGIGNYDFSVSRDFNLSERFRLQFRMDSFNFTNTPHLSNPRNTVGSSSFMTIHGVSSLAREGIDERQFEFGLKLFF